MGCRILFAAGLVWIELNYTLNHRKYMSNKEIFFQSEYKRAPELSIILLDWSVRESFHTLDYLNLQVCDRDSFEIIWIEFYGRHSEEIEKRFDRCRELSLPDPVDLWMCLNEPADQCYHKHVMYNEGILRARGDILVVLDSDAILRTDLIQTIHDEFEKQPLLALHFEQIRNFDQRYYPFSYPSIQEMNGEGCVNASLGIPNGFETCAKSLKKDWGLWNIYNYGACFCARKEDIVMIGGADEHDDYMGHVCGPYEMTARLINAGIEDKLHSDHYLYHSWHPNQGGGNNYIGPSDGKGMSTTAMAIPKTKRILPLKENEEIKERRLMLESSTVPSK